MPNFFHLGMAHWSQLAAALAAIGAAFAGVLRLVRFIRNSGYARRASLRIDLQILKQLDSSHPQYEAVKVHVDTSLALLYGHQEARLKVYRLDDLVFGIAFTVGLTVWTAYLIAHDPCWAILTGLFALGALSTVLDAFKPQSTAPAGK